MLTVAHVTDVHHGGPRRARKRHQRVLDHLLAMSPPPDLLLLTGDVADHGLPEEYAEAREVWDRWPGRRLVLPGNHDVREALAAAFLPEHRLDGRGRDGDDRLDQEVVVDGVRVVALDSLVAAPAGDRLDHGELTDASLAWLDERLSSVRLPTLVCLHHPPVPLGTAAGDRIRLRDADRLEAVLARHDSVLAVLVGHAHAVCATTFAGVPVLVGGAVATDLVPLDAEEHEMRSDGPITFALHLLLEGRLVTHWRVLPG